MINLNIYFKIYNQIFTYLTNYIFAVILFFIIRDWGWLNYKGKIPNTHVINRMFGINPQMKYIYVLNTVFNNFKFVNFYFINPIF